MKFSIVYDASSEAGLEETLFGANQALRNYFADRFYDDSGIGIAIVVVCRDPYWNFKRRVRYSKKENRLYIDIMLSLDEMSTANESKRKEIVAEKIITEVPETIEKYKFKDFDLQRFSSDLRSWFEDRRWFSKGTWPAEI